MPCRQAPYDIECGPCGNAGNRFCHIAGECRRHVLDKKIHDCRTQEWAAGSGNQRFQAEVAIGFCENRRCRGVDQRPNNPRVNQANQMQTRNEQSRGADEGGKLCPDNIGMDPGVSLQYQKSS